MWFVSLPSVNDAVRLSRWRWIGYILTSESYLVQDIPEWRLQGNRGYGGPLETWLRIMQTEVKRDLRGKRLVA